MQRNSWPAATFPYKLHPVFRGVTSVIGSLLNFPWS